VLKATLESLFAATAVDAARDSNSGRHAVARAGGSVQVFGFVPDMERLLSAADLVVGKAGPASTMEALAVGRPVLATAYAGLNELAVTRFLGAHAVGEYVPGWGRLPEAVSTWRNDPLRLAAASRAAERLDFVAMKRGLGAYLVECARVARGSTHRSRGAGSSASAVPVGSLLDASGSLEPGAFAAVTRASLAP
jgi:hypothetical protein